MSPIFRGGPLDELPGAALGFLYHRRLHEPEPVEEEYGRCQGHREQRYEKPDGGAAGCAVPVAAIIEAFQDPRALDQYDDRPHQAPGRGRPRRGRKGSPKIVTPGRSPAPSSRGVNVRLGRTADGTAAHEEDNKALRAVTGSFRTQCGRRRRLSALAAAHVAPPPLVLPPAILLPIPREVTRFCRCRASNLGKDCPPCGCGLTGERHSGGPGSDVRDAVAVPHQENLIPQAGNAGEIGHRLRITSRRPGPGTGREK